jgi:uncharacterized protein (TIGR00369 family)
MNERPNFAGLSGLEAIRAMMDGGRDIATIGQTLDFTLVEADFGKAVFEARPSERHLNPNGIVHGGYAATLLDSCTGMAIQSALPAGRTFTTLELKVNYIRVMAHDGSPVRATGQTIHVGRTTATAEGRITDGEGRLLAHATTTCLMLDIPSPRDR